MMLQIDLFVAGITKQKLSPAETSILGLTCYLSLLLDIPIPGAYIIRMNA